MITYPLHAQQGCTFRLTLDFSPWIAGNSDFAAWLAAGCPAESGAVKMELRTSPFAPAPAYTFATNAETGGRIVVNAATGLAVFAAPARDMDFVCTLYPRAVFEHVNGAAPLFGGTVKFSPGAAPVLGGDGYGDGLPDTVTIDGQLPASVAVVPVTLATAVSASAASAAQAEAAAQASAAAAEALMFPTTLTLDLSTPGDSLLFFF